VVFGRDEVQKEENGLDIGGESGRTRRIDERSYGSGSGRCGGQAVNKTALAWPSRRQSKSNDIRPANGKRMLRENAWESYRRIRNLKMHCLDSS
jgi:hypothetical protein